MTTSNSSICRVCIGNQPNAIRQSLQKKHLAFGLNGLIAQTPFKGELPSWSKAHLKLDSAAFNHPCVILEASPCGHLVHCLKVTSFGGKTIQEKFHTFDLETKRKRFNQYVALRRADTDSHNVHGELDHCGDEMPKQSYVELQAFWIEWQHLKVFCGGHRQLKSASFAKLYELFQRRQKTLADAAPARPLGVCRRNDTPTLTQIPESHMIVGHVPALTADDSWHPTIECHFVIPERRNAAIEIRAPG